MILALSGDEKLVGYVDYRDDSSDPENLYLSSIQIESGFRGGVLFRRLVARLIEELKTRKFKQLATHVQSTNTRMIQLFRGLGFQVVEASSPTWQVFGSRELLFDDAIHRVFRIAP